MLEIKNPYSRKRLTFKQRFYKKFTESIVPYIKKIPIQKDMIVKQKYIPKFLQQARISVESWERFAWSTKRPDNIDIDLLSLHVAEYIPIENIDELNKGLKKLFKKYPFKYHFFGQIKQVTEYVDEFCNEVKQSIHGGRWSNFGYLDFSKEKNLSDLIKQVHIHGTHISSSLIILQFIITPSTSFIKEYKKVMDSDVKGGKVFTPTFKNFFTFWDSKGVSESNYKEQKLEDLILELKWRTMNEISKYFDLYLTKQKLIPPSIEVYKLNQSSCMFNEEDEKRNLFWESIGMQRFQCEISKDGYWQLFSNKGNHLIDSSLKITCNSKVKKRPGYESLDIQIVYSVGQFSKGLLPILVIREYVVDLSKNIAARQKNTFSSIKKEKTKYKKLINIRYELEQNLHILKRFKYEIDENYFENVKDGIIRLSEFEPVRPKLDNEVWVERIVDNTDYMIDKTYNHSENFAKIIDDTVRLLEIKTNNSLRRMTFFLTIITVILSVVATTIAGTSLYLQLDEKDRQLLNEVFKSIEIFLFKIFTLVKLIFYF